MTSVDWATLVYLGCFQACAWPQILRIARRRSSADLALGREALLIAGCLAQLHVITATQADWRVLIGPIGTLVSVLILTSFVLWFRGGRRAAPCYQPNVTPPSPCARP